MARVRTVTYGFSMNVPSAGTFEVALPGLLRDILPDQSFRVSTLIVMLRHELAPGDTATVILAKNVAATLPFLIDAATTKHGIINRFELVKMAGEGVFDGASWVVQYPEPLDFDEDDSLNVVVGGTSTAVAIQQVYATISVAYEAS